MDDTGPGLTTVVSPYTVPETLKRLEDLIVAGTQAIRAHRSQRRGGEGRSQNESGAGLDIRQPGGGNSDHGGCPDFRDRLAA